MLKRVVLAVVFVAASILPTMSFAATGGLFGGFFAGRQSSITTTAVPEASGHISITINIAEQEMVVQDERHTIYVWDVSTGRPGHATPTGRYKPIRMHEMWYSSKYENAPMPWSIFFYGGYAIHGTTDVKHLGHVASHGCVRLDPANAKLLYDLVKEVGMKNTAIALVRS
ncbi:MAG: L,D-transpeptidase [Devosia sp.]